MTRAGRTLAAAVVAAGLGALGCGDAGQEVPVSGTAVVSLTSAATDGAILVRVTGPAFMGAPVSAGSGAKLYWRQVSESEILVALFGTIGGGALFQLEIPDGDDVGRYAGTVLDAADRSDAQRTNLGAYTVRITVGS